MVLCTLLGTVDGLCRCLVRHAGAGYSPSVAAAHHYLVNPPGANWHFLCDDDFERATLIDHDGLAGS